MILHLKKDVPAELIEKTAKEFHGKVISTSGVIKLITSKSHKIVSDELRPFVIDEWLFTDDMQLSSKQYAPPQPFSIGEAPIGSNSGNLHLIAGPCSVENEEQIFKVAHHLKSIGIKSLRAGCYKPRTSPYSFMGLGKEGLMLLDKVRTETGLNIVTEVRDSTHVEEVIECADVVQIGTKSMYDHGILNACGRSNKIVLLKRGFGTTLQEFVQAAEFILSAGNHRVILCERGIRTFESKTRFTLDLCGVTYLKHHCNLPIIVDPSHALGARYGIADLSRAAVALKIDGLLIESHPNPENALSDAAQQLSLEALSELKLEVDQLCLALNLNLV